MHHSIVSGQKLVQRFELEMARAVLWAESTAVETVARRVAWRVAEKVEQTATEMVARKVE